MRILVTGANGYLGQGIVKQILDNGHEVIATGFKTDHVDSRAISYACNLFEIQNPYEFFGKPDVMLHLAWHNGFVHNSNTHILDLPKHFEFIKVMFESGIKKIAVMGSMHEIGFYEGCINKDTPCNPMSLYGISKDALRKCVQLLASSNKATFQWLRGYYIVGNSKYGQSIFSKISSAEAQGNSEFPFTMGQNQYDFLDYNDFCFRVAAAVGQTNINGIINICSGKPEKLADRVERFIHDNRYSIHLKYGAFPDRPYDSKAVWGDSRIIEKILKNDNFRA
jgi:dTDP-6-deoxy-L-talose 4-dehydrogenase (NAD+)